MAKSEPALIAIAYRYFMAVAELGSVRAASRDLNVAASAISRQLILLETALGNRLFDRSGRGKTHGGGLHGDRPAQFAKAVGA